MDTSATVQRICSPGYTSQPGVRDVTDVVKDSVYRLYGAVRTSGKPTGAPTRPMLKAGPVCCEVDHLVSLELGGSNAVANLWPEPYPDATEKDKVENGLHWLVCHGRLALAVAQRGLAGNWVRIRDSLVKAGTGSVGRRRMRRWGSVDSSPGSGGSIDRCSGNRRYHRHRMRRRGRSFCETSLPFHRCAANGAAMRWKRLTILWCGPHDSGVVLPSARGERDG